MACSSQRPHSCLGAEGTIVPPPAGGHVAWGLKGVSTQKEGMRLEKLPAPGGGGGGSSLKVPTRSQSGPFRDPKLGP